jgi:ssDNA thymidine ADP-ribosyltransferase, DarT
VPKSKPEVKSLYYITHMDNLPSIFREGILAHGLIEKLQISYTPIYDSAIVTNRKEKQAPNGNSLWDFANFYFQPRNPMLYRVLHEKGEKQVVVLGVSPGLLSTPGAFVAVGNAANATTEILPAEKGLKAVFAIWEVINSEWWNSVDGSKRKIMAECLVAGRVMPDSIHSVFVSTHEVAEKVRKLGLPPRVSIVPQPTIFFRPQRKYQIAPQISLADGDMFFSQMQTLTVSVNTVGIMGKGLASRAKYQFPDVYVTYQDACRRKLVRLGKPFLYKREAYIDADLADEPETLKNVNANKWFLLFATKRHWRDASDIIAIQDGLHWIRDNYKKEGIRSLALPALGCGLGRLDWKDVGPVICQEVDSLDIPVVVYLPREHIIPEEFLTPDFLLAEAGRK